MNHKISMKTFLDFCLCQTGRRFNIAEDGYKNTSFEKLKQDDIDNFQITNGYRQFVQRINDERKKASALRDVLAFPDISLLESTQDLQTELMLFNRAGKTIL